MKGLRIIQSKLYQIKKIIYLQSYLLIKLHKLVNLYNKIIKKMIKFVTKTKILVMIISNCNIKDLVKFFTTALTVSLMIATIKNFHF